MNTMMALVKREFWEHRSLWIAPLIWVGIIVVLFSWGVFVQAGSMHEGPLADANAVQQMQPEQRAHAMEELAKHGQDVDKGKQAVTAFTYLAISGLISGFTCVVVFFYLIDCLFTERRDRSILFWKSLPVSDSQVVLSKFATAMVAVPLGAFLLAGATHLVMMLLMWLRLRGTIAGEFIGNWDSMTWLRSEAIGFIVTLAGVLWYAPIAAYFMLLSAWARRLVFLWAVVPLIAIPVLEAFFFHSANFSKFLGRRFSGYMSELHIDQHLFNTENGQHLPDLREVFDRLDLSAMFTSMEMWMGLAAAAVMIYVTIRIRRWRDDA